MTGDDGNRGATASPPCFLHEADAAYTGIGTEIDLQQRADVMRWRKVERERLLAARMAVPATVRDALGKRIAVLLEEAIGPFDGLTVSAYWPIRGEPDMRALLARVAARGGCAALPVVVGRGEPLLFRRWTPGDPLERGIWNIPVPRPGAALAVPDVVVAPVVGFDGDCFRLGYGGGFFDRTLAVRTQRPRVFGVGFGQARIKTIFPQPHDIAMDAIVTEDEVLKPAMAVGKTPQ